MSAVIPASSDNDLDEITNEMIHHTISDVGNDTGAPISSTPPMCARFRRPRRESMGYQNIMGSIRHSFSQDNSMLDFFSMDGHSHSDWEEGVAVIESILIPASDAMKGLSSSQVAGLQKVQKILLDQQEEQSVHIPRGLLRRASEPGNTSDYLLAQFAGMRRVPAKQRVKSIINANRFISRLHLQVESSKQIKTSKDAFELTEWTRLDASVKRKLAEHLSWEKLQKWDFDMFEVDLLCQGQSLLFVGWAILGSPYSQHVMQRTLHEEGTDIPPPPKVDNMPGYGFPDQFKMPQEALINFLRVIEADYQRRNPYHNNVHAADVLQSLHAMLYGMNANTLATAEIEIFSLLLAAVVHDVAHPGRNNNFQVNSRSALALEYNDVSVLENLHASRAFHRLMGAGCDPSINIFQGMSTAQTSSVREMVIESVLDTDMTKHFATVSKIKGIRLSNHKKNRELKDNDAWQVLHFVLHMADISNPAKPLRLAVQWTDRCLEEFFEQGDEEKRLGLPVSPLCDRMTTQRADSQWGFIKFVVQPAFDILGKIVPTVATEILPILEKNLKYWEKEQRQENGILETSECSDES